MAIGLLILRLTVGVTLAAHGLQKVFGLFGGLGLDATGQAFETLGFRPGRRHALIAGASEVAAGLMLALGLATPLAATMIVSIMFVAAVSVHARNGFFITENGVEYNLVFGVAALTLAFTGPGALALDVLVGIPTGGTVWGVLVLAAGLVGGFIQLAQRRAEAAGQQA
jgi:putative oxidoreductase